MFKSSLISDLMSTTLLMLRPIANMARNLLSNASCLPIRYYTTKKVVESNSSVDYAEDDRHVLQYLQRQKHHLSKEQLLKHVVVEIKEEDIEEKFARGSGPGLYDILCVSWN